MARGEIFSFNMRYEQERAPDVAFTDVKDYQKG